MIQNRTTSPDVGQSMNVSYCITINAFVKFIQIFFGIVAAGCASRHLCIENASYSSNYQCYKYNSDQWSRFMVQRQDGQGFVLFVISVFIICTVLTLLFAFTNFEKSDFYIQHLDVPRSYLELGFNTIAVVFYFIIAIVESWYANGFNMLSSFIEVLNPDFRAWIASAVFIWFNVILYAISAMMVFMPLVRDRNDDRKTQVEQDEQEHHISYIEHYQPAIATAV